jgi:hypothetical protein
MIDSSKLEMTRFSEHREAISKAFGPHLHLSGRHPYLYPEEAAELVSCIVEWKDSMSRPKISDLPLLVLSCSFFSISYYNIPLFFLGFRNPKEKTSFYYRGNLEAEPDLGI